LSKILDNLLEFNIHFLFLHPLHLFFLGLRFGFLHALFHTYNLLSEVLYVCFKLGTVVVPLVVPVIKVVLWKDLLLLAFLLLLAKVSRRHRACFLDCVLLHMLEVPEVEYRHLLAQVQFQLVRACRFCLLLRWC
jgi:hypothetical protein